MLIETPPDDLGFNFRHFIGGLCDVVAAYLDRNAGAAALIVAIIGRLCRRQDRFMSILARFRAGTLRRPCFEDARQAQGNGAASPRAPDPVPRCRAYLVRLLKHEAAVYGRIFEILLADPEMKAVLAASPQAGRLLRPLWRMLHRRPLPAVLRPMPPSIAPPPPKADSAAAPPDRASPQALPLTLGRRPARVRAARGFGPATPILA